MSLGSGIRLSVALAIKILLKNGMRALDYSIISLRKA